MHRAFPLLCGDSRGLTQNRGGWGGGGGAGDGDVVIFKSYVLTIT